MLNEVIKIKSKLLRLQIVLWVLAALLFEYSESLATKNMMMLENSSLLKSLGQSSNYAVSSVFTRNLADNIDFENDMLIDYEHDIESSSEIDVKEETKKTKKRKVHKLKKKKTMNTTLDPSIKEMSKNYCLSILKPLFNLIKIEGNFLILLLLTVFL